MKDLLDVVSNTEQEFRVTAPIRGGIAGSPIEPRRNNKATERLIRYELSHRVGLELSWSLNPLSHSETNLLYRGYHTK